MRFFEARPVQPISQFAPIDTGALFASMQGRQQEFNQGLQAIDETMSLLDVNAVPEHFEDRNKLLGNFSGRVQSLADKYMQSADPNVLSELSRVRQDWVNSQDRLALETQFNNESAYNKDAAKARSEGRLDPLLDPKPGWVYRDPETGRPRANTYSGIESLLDINPDVIKAMESITADAFGSDNYFVDKDGLLVIDGKKTKTLGTDKIKEVAQGKLNTTLEGAAAKQFIRRKVAAGGTEQDARNEILSMLVNEGMKQAFGETERTLKVTETAEGEEIGKGRGRKSAEIQEILPTERKEISTRTVNTPTGVEERKLVLTDYADIGSTPIKTKSIVGNVIDITGDQASIKDLGDVENLEIVAVGDLGSTSYFGKDDPTGAIAASLYKGKPVLGQKAGMMVGTYIEEVEEELDAISKAQGKTPQTKKIKRTVLIPVKGNEGIIADKVRISGRNDALFSETKSTVGDQSVKQTTTTETPTRKTTTTTSVTGGLY